MPRSRIPDANVAELYLSGEPMESMVSIAGVSRQALYAALRRAGVELSRRVVLELVCPFCKEKFKRNRSHVKGSNGGYCSVQCFHADRSLCGVYSDGGDVLAEHVGVTDKVSSRAYGLRARQVLADAGVVLLPGQVVHHIDGDRSNNDVSNLRVFNSHSEHMKFHHSLRAEKRVQCKRVVSVLTTC